MLAYLAGAIEYAPDHGRGWRKRIAPFLRDELGHEVYDPAQDERKSLTLEEQQNLRRWKTADLPRFQAAVRKIIDFDLDMVARANYVICHWDEYCAKGAGTAAELTHARRHRIPVYLVSSMPIELLSGWILGCSTQIFTDFEQLKNFLRIQLEVPGPEF